MKRKRIVTQKELIWYLKRLKPRYRIRVPIRCKRPPFLVQVGISVPGNTIQIRESVWIKLRNANKVELLHTVDTEIHHYQEYVYNPDGKRKGNR